VGSQEVAGPAAGSEHAITCGYLHWNYCYERAEKLCPGGFKVLSEREAPRELRIACQAVSGKAETSG
jgi:hypothetical protein